ncbi:DUF2142 domain-containing protein [Microbacterium sp. gxy059]|uniref:DUF2142 domain-containing protein n=1 Tax=Microbacterium sp. gxy059 TaxID=2957199 RepID=UPI003D97231B
MSDAPAHGARARREQRVYRGSVAVIALATFVISLLWGLALPHFTGPDEPRHYNSVARLVDGGGWPLPYEARVVGSTWEAVGESGLELPDPEYTVEVPPAAERSAFLADSDLPEFVRDQMVQHPPGYYLVGSTLIAAVGGGELRWDHAAFLLRGLSAALIACAVPFIAGAVRWATGSRWAGVLGGLFPLFVPWFTVSGGTITNDALLIAACSATIWALVRAWHDARAASWLLPVAGVAYGVALMSKGYAMMLAPVVVVLAVGAAWRATRSAWRTLVRVLVPGVIAFAIGGWWWVRNVLLLGTLQPSVLGSRERQEIPVDGYSFEVFVEAFLTRLNATFWGRVGYAATANPSGAIIAAGILLVAIVLAALVFSRSRWMLLLLLAFPVIIAVTIFRNAHGIYWDIGDPTRGTQGRYLYSGIAAFALAFAALTHTILARRRAPLRAAVAPVAAGLAAAILVASAFWVVPFEWQAYHGISGISPAEVATRMDVSGATYGVLLAVAALLLAAGAAGGAFLGAREEPSGRSRVPERIPA